VGSSSISLLSSLDSSWSGDQSKSFPQGLKPLNKSSPLLQLLNDLHDFPEQRIEAVSMLSVVDAVLRLLMRLLEERLFLGSGDMIGSSGAGVSTISSSIPAPAVA